VNIVHAQCSDGMSDRTFPTVQADVDGSYSGCGGAAVAPASLVELIGAWSGQRRPTPGDQYFMNFEADRFRSKFGCNGMGGGYRQMATRSSLTSHGNEDGLPGHELRRRRRPRASQPLTMQWQDGDRLRLSSGPQRPSTRRAATRTLRTMSSWVRRLCAF
jgi:hypothetical protein